MALRILGLGWGLPSQDRLWSLHPDEPIVWGYSQQLDPARLDFDPGFYNYGTLYLSLVNVSTSVVQGYGGGPSGPSVEAQAAAIGRYHLAGRVISALAGAGLCWVVFALLLRLTNLFGACFGGLALVVAPALVVHSRFQTVDMLATLLGASALFFAVRLVQRDPDEDQGRLVDAALGGLMAGLSAGTKYSGVLALLAVIVAVFVAWRSFPGVAALRLSATSLGACVLAFLLATPGALLNPSRFVEDFRYEMAHTSEGHGLVFAGTAPGFAFHAQNLVQGMGMFLVLLGGAGLLAAALRRKPWAWCLIAAGLATYVLIGRAEVKFMRYVFPLMPVLAVGAGWLAGQAHAHPVRRWRLVGVAGMLGLGGLGGGGLADSAAATMWMAGPDPRDVAGEWLRKQAAGRSIGLVSDPWFYSPTLYPGAAAPRSIPFAKRDAEMRSVRDPKILRHVPADANARLDWDPDLLETSAPEYVTFSSFEFDDPDRLRRLGVQAPEFAALLDRFEAFGESLARDYAPVKAFAPEARNMRWVHDMMYIRPTIWVWKRRPSSPSPSRPSSTTSRSSEAPRSTP